MLVAWIRGGQGTWVYKPITFAKKKNEANVHAQICNLIRSEYNQQLKTSSQCLGSRFRTNRNGRVRIRIPSGCVCSVLVPDEGLAKGQRPGQLGRRRFAWLTHAERERQARDRERPRAHARGKGHRHRETARRGRKKKLPSLQLMKFGCSDGFPSFQQFQIFRSLSKRISPNPCFLYFFYENKPISIQFIYDFI